MQDACQGGDLSHPNHSEVKDSTVCGDGDDVSDEDLSWWTHYADTLARQSRVLGRNWSSTRLICSSWPARANWRFTGPYTTPLPDASAKPGVPSAPILFLSNRLDPVTPLSGARKMSRSFPGSRIVVQEAMGHVALLSAQSECTWSILSDYLDTGNMPKEGTTCKPKCGPWDANCAIGA